MKLPDYRKDYDTYSSKTGELCRQLSFAGIAVIWIFVVQTDSGRKLPPDLLLPCICLVASLAADFFQYATATVVWYAYYRHLEKEGRDDLEDIPWHPVYLTWPQQGFFWIRVIFVSGAYVLLLRALFHRLAM